MGSFWEPYHQLLSVHWLLSSLCLLVSTLLMSPLRAGSRHHRIWSFYDWFASFWWLCSKYANFSWVYDITLRNVIQRKEGMYKSWSSKVAIAKECFQMKFVTTQLMSCLFLQYTSIGQFSSPIMSPVDSLSKNRMWHHHHQVWEVAYDKYDCGVT